VQYTNHTQLAVHTEYLRSSSSRYTIDVALAFTALARASCTAFLFFAAFQGLDRSICHHHQMMGKPPNFKRGRYRIALSHYAQCVLRILPTHQLLRTHQQSDRRPSPDTIHDALFTTRHAACGATTVLPRNDLQSRQAKEMLRSQSGNWNRPASTNARIVSRIVSWLGKQRLPSIDADQISLQVCRLGVSLFKDYCVSASPGSDLVRLPLLKWPFIHPSPPSRPCCLCGYTNLMVS
jgi:hypothetical protein